MKQMKIQSIIILSCLSVSLLASSNVKAEEKKLITKALWEEVRSTLIEGCEESNFSDREVLRAVCECASNATINDMKKKLKIIYEEDIITKQDEIVNISHYNGAVCARKTLK